MISNYIYEKFISQYSGSKNTVVVISKNKYNGSKLIILILILMRIKEEPCNLCQSIHAEQKGMYSKCTTYIQKPNNTHMLSSHLITGSIVQSDGNAKALTITESETLELGEQNHVFS